MTSPLASNNYLATAARHRHHHFLPAKRLPYSILSPTRCRATHVARARKGLSSSSSSSRSRRLEKRGNKGGGGAGTTVKEAEEVPGEVEGAPLEEGIAGGLDGGLDGLEYSTTPMPAQQGEEKDFWEGPQWDGLGFFVQYQWAFGIVFALIACGIAVATYNEGATDFRQTPVYKESIQSQDLLEEPEASDADVFEANPTEVAPSLD